MLVLRFLPLAVLAGFFLELASLIWVGSRIGVVITLLMVVAGGVAGVGVIRSTGLGLATAMRRAELGRQFSTVDAGVVFLRMAAGLLLIVPGFFSDAAGLVLLVPPVARWLSSRLAPPVNMEFRSGPSQRRGTVIEGEVVEIEGDLRGPGDQSR